MAWLSGGWNKRIKLTLDKDQVDAALSNFPVMVYLSAASGIGDVDASCVFDELGSDANRKKVAFTSSDGTTELYAEIERFDYANEKAWYHAKPTSVSDAVDEILYFYYDSTHADNTTYVGDTTDAVTHNVWDANFSAVYHMAQDPNGDGADAIKDSTSNANEGTPDGTMTTADLVDGKVGKGIAFDGGDDNLQVGDDNSLDLGGAFSVFARIKTPTLGTEGIISKGETHSSYKTMSYRLFVTSTGRISAIVCDNGTHDEDHGKQYQTAEAELSVDTWHSIGFTFNAGTLKIYKDGSEITVGIEKLWDPAITAAYTNTDSLILGSYIYNNAIFGGGCFDGIIDEVCISSTDRSAPWIKATYHSLWDSLITFGAEEIESSIETVISESFTGTFELSAPLASTIGSVIVTAEPFTGVFTLSGGGAVIHSNLVGAVPFTLTATFSTPTPHVISRTLFNDTLSLINSLKVGSTLSLINSLNVTLTSNIRFVLDILSKIEGNQTIRLDIEELAKFNDTLNLINHILDADSGITQGDYYFLKSHGI